MNIPPPPQSGPAVPAAPGAGPVRLQPRSLGSCVATLGEAERSAGGGEPPKARHRSGPPAALPAGSAGPTTSPAQGHRAPRRVRVPPPRTRSQPERTRTLPGQPLRPWSPETAGRVGARSEQGDPSHGRGRVRGQWRRRALIGDICPRARPLCGPELPAPPRQPLVAGPDVMGAANSGRAAGGRVIRLVAGPRGGAAGAREGVKPPVKPNFWSKGTAAPLRLHTPLAASPLRSTSAPWGKGGGAEGLSSGHGVSPGDRAAGTHCGTGCAQHFHTALSLPQHSLLLRSPPPPAPADPSPPHPTAGLGGPTILGSTLCSSLKDPESGLVGPRPAPTSPPTPHNAADVWASIPGAYGGTPHELGPRHPQDPSQETLAGARPRAAISAVLSPIPPSPCRRSWALKAGGWAGPQAEAAAGAGGWARELSERRAPPPEPPSLPPTFPRPALPEHPSPPGPPPPARRRRRRRSLRLQNNKARLPETPAEDPRPAAEPPRPAPRRSLRLCAPGRWPRGGTAGWEAGTRGGKEGRKEEKREEKSSEE
ncbi:hypothetical protein AB1E18_010780 [Capra hircus]